MRNSFSVGMPFFPSVKFYQRGDFFYFVNPAAGNWVALPGNYAKNLFDKKSARYFEAYEALAKNNIIRDSNLNPKKIPLEMKPLMVHFQPTGKCNLQCKYCFNPSEIRNKDMTEKTMRRAVDYCFENPFTRESAPMFLIYGGEPLMNKKLLFETVKYIRNRAANTYIGIITNATLLTEDDIIFFKAQNVTLIISFDGLPEFQYKNRSGTADKVLAKLELLKKYDCLKKSSILCVVTREMSARLLECVLFLQSFGVESLEFLPLNLLNNAQGLSAISTDTAAFIESLKKIVEAIEDGQINRLHMRNILRLLIPLASNQNIKGELGGHRCSAGRNVLAITADGKILACDMIPEKFQPEIGDVWSGITSLDKFDAKISPYASAECKKCLWQYFCRSGCTGSCAADNGDLNTRPLLTCSTNKEMYPYLLEKLATDGGKLRKYFNQSIDA